jgi:MerR family transcriptional regulator, heat shock protein HspR
VASHVPDPTAGVYGISVAADLVGTGVQNLRAYEKAGLVEPRRTSGGTRLYSSDDIARMRRIADLVAEGLNLNAIAIVLDLQDANERLRRENARFRSSSRKS